MYPSPRNSPRTLPITIFLLVVLSLAIIVNPCDAFLLDWYSDDAVAKYRLSGAVCSYVERFYVDHDRIHPRQMLTEALSWTERLLPSVLVQTSESSDMEDILPGGQKKPRPPTRKEPLAILWTPLKNPLLLSRQTAPNRTNRNQATLSTP